MKVVVSYYSQAVVEVDDKFKALDIPDYVPEPDNFRELYEGLYDAVLEKLPGVDYGMLSSVYAEESGICLAEY